MECERIERIARFPVRRFGGGVSDGSGTAIDLAHLAQYTDGDSKLEREVLAMFLPSVQGYLAQMEAATSATAWLHATHAIKGVARGVGAFALGNVAEEAEQNYSENEAARREAIGQLAKELELIAKFIESRLKN